MLEYAYGGVELQGSGDKAGGVFGYSRECKEKEGRFITSLEEVGRRGQPGLGDLPHYLFKQCLPSANFCQALFLPFSDSLQGLESVL